MRNPRVTVCIPTFNRAFLPRRSLESALRQKFEDFGLIISDNDSGDDTEEIVKSFHDSRLLYRRNRVNLGIRDNWSRCFELARGVSSRPFFRATI
jgi:glycosyltransferase involved in cell wall biosynthesis